LLRHAYISCLLDAPSLCFACNNFGLFHFPSTHPDNAFFAEGIHLLWGLGVPVLFLLQVSRSTDSLQWYVGVTVSEERGPWSYLGQVSHLGLSLPLAEISAARSLVATGPLTLHHSFHPTLLKNFSQGSPCRTVRVLF
jgi:hypothetical protein